MGWLLFCSFKTNEIASIPQLFPATATDHSMAQSRTSIQINLRVATKNFNNTFQTTNSSIALWTSPQLMSLLQTTIPG